MYNVRFREVIFIVKKEAGASTSKKSEQSQTMFKSTTQNYKLLKLIVPHSTLIQY
ncbi:hypothetical protein TPHV1_120090 [Treponema phagedenis]|uniref:Uncharacterized protein n=1 Tax=Treponema phagedenis TaxID=162 RepID=A0A0B7GWE5_TREPH|nr:hypothetical protein TPHV1_120090 [Treponema phagedenis]